MIFKAPCANFLKIPQRGSERSETSFRRSTSSALLVFEDRIDVKAVKAYHLDSEYN